MVESAAVPGVPPRDWGQTTNLGVLANMGTLADGMQERICRRLDGMAPGGVELGFDYLGEITAERGNTPRDNDVQFAKLLRDRLAALHPRLAAELTAKGVLEATLEAS